MIAVDEASEGPLGVPIESSRKLNNNLVTKHIRNLPSWSGCCEILFCGADLLGTDGNCSGKWSTIITRRLKREACMQIKIRPFSLRTKQTAS